MEARATTNVDVFVLCNGRRAAHRVNLSNYVSAAPNGKRCFTRFGDDLLLCDSCTKFWLLDLGMRQLTTLQEAVSLRRARHSV